MEQDVACQFEKRGLRDSKACARFAFGVIQADTVARANCVVWADIKKPGQVCFPISCARCLLCAVIHVNKEFWVGRNKQRVRGSSPITYLGHDRKRTCL